MLDAKTRKLKGLRKESGNVRIKLRAAIGFFWALQEKRELFGTGSAVIAG